MMGFITPEMKALGNVGIGGVPLGSHEKCQKTNKRPKLDIQNARCNANNFTLRLFLYAEQLKKHGAWHMRPPFETAAGKMARDLFRISVTASHGKGSPSSSREVEATILPKESLLLKNHASTKG